MASPKDKFAHILAHPPKERISTILSFLHIQQDMWRTMSHAVPMGMGGKERELHSQMTELVLGAIKEDPSCATASYPTDPRARPESFRSPGMEMPLMHLVCRLGYLTLIRAVYSVTGPDSLRIEVNEQLPVHTACLKSKGVVTLEVIQFLINEYPESANIAWHGKLPMQMALGGLRSEADNIALLDFFSGLISDDDFKKATDEISFRLDDGGRNIPLGFMQALIQRKNFKSVILKGTVNPNQLKLAGDNDVMVVEVIYDYYPQLLLGILGLSIPLKKLELNTRDDKLAICNFARTLDPPEQEDFDFDEFDEMVYSLIGIHAVEFPRPEPLEQLILHDVEDVSINSVIKDEMTMMDFVTCLRCIPNLKALEIGGLDHCCYGYETFPLTSEYLDAMARILNETKNLTSLNLNYVRKNVALPLADFLLKYNHLEHVSLVTSDNLTFDEVKSLTRFLQTSKSIKSLTLGPFIEGANHIVDIIKDGGSTLETFRGYGGINHEDGGYSYLQGSELIDTWLTINGVTRCLGSTSIEAKEAFELFKPHMQNTQVIYNLLKFRPELWSQGNSDKAKV